MLENEEDIRGLICLRLERLGVEVVCCDSCADALKALKRRRFSVAVLDLGLPVIDGKTCGGYIHTLYPSLPLVAFTGYEEAADDEGLMREHGFVRRYVKARDEARLIEDVLAFAEGREAAA